MTAALLLALTPAPLVLALAGAGLAAGRAATWVRFGAVAALLATLTLLCLDAAPVVAGGRILASFGQAMPGVPYLFRADSIAVTVAVAATAAALLTLLSSRALEPRRAPALLLCVLGSVVASLAGNAVLLFAGIELANIGTFGLLRGSDHHPGRAALVTLGLEHLGALGLLAAAANLQASVGTSDFTALPGGVVTAAVAVPWALGATARLITPALAPLRSGVTTAAWAAAAAVPTGALMLLRLREAAGGVQPLGGSVSLAIAGALVAAGGAAIVVRHARLPAWAGRGLCLAVAGPVIALTGISLPVAATAVAAGLGALEIAVAATVLWERASDTARERALAAVALVATSGLPLGFGATAVVLELSAALGLGAAGFALLLGLGAAAVAAAAGAVRVAGALVHRSTGASSSVGLPAPLGVVALAAAAAGAVVPGAYAGWLNAALGNPGTLADAGAAAVSGPAGGWPGGYFAIAALVLGATLLAALSLSGLRIEAEQPAAAAALPPRRLPVRLSTARRVHGAARTLQAAIPRVDAWAAQQPQLPLIAAGGLLAIVLIR